MQDPPGGRAGDGHLLPEYGQFVALLESDPSTTKELLRDATEEQLENVESIYNDQIIDIDLMDPDNADRAMRMLYGRELAKRSRR